MPRLGTDDDAHRNNTTNRRPTHIPVGSNNMATAYAANNHEPSSRLTGILFILAITFILKNVLFHQYALDETNNVQKMKHDIAYLLQAVQEVKEQLNGTKTTPKGTTTTTNHKTHPISNVSIPLTVWKSSGTKLVTHSGDSVLNDVLNCAPLKSGTFEWKIQLHSAYPYYLYLGVIGSNLKLPLDNWIGNTKKTWGYESKGGSAYYWNDGRKDISNLPKYTAGSVVHLFLGVIASSLKLPLDDWIGWTQKTWGYRSKYGEASYWNEGQKYIQNLPKYTTGSVVHFVLDLTNEGTLCVSVDGSPSVQLFSNMKSLIDKDEGFLPATSMWSENKIELLEFKSLPIDISSLMIQKTLYS